MATRWVGAAGLLVLSACAAKPPPSAITTTTAAELPDLAKVRTYFAELDAACTRDGGKLWGRSLCGPVLLVDEATREVISSRADRGHVLAARDGLFVGTWPKDQAIANTAVDWQGARWTMFTLESVEGSPAKRSALMLHEAFHRLQPELHLEPKDAGLNRHLDERDGRYWLQLEWNALGAALSKEATDPARGDAISDALTFRGARRARFPEAARAEAALEIHEGLAEYTGQRAAGWTKREVVEGAVDRRGWTKSFVRGFAYVSGPLYGYLLDETGAAWRTQVSTQTDLGDLLAEVGGAAPQRVERAEAIAWRHGGEALARAEDDRERARVAQTKEWRRQLVDGPVLVLDKKEAKSGSFDPNQLYPLGEDQTVCTHCAIIASWGTLTVEDGTMLKDDATERVHVSLAGASPDGMKGAGWSLELAKGWAIAPGERAGDLHLVRRP